MDGGAVVLQEKWEEWLCWGELTLSCVKFELTGKSSGAKKRL